MRALRAGRPLWLDLNPHRSTSTYPLLAGHHEADVAIVGGGMTGSTIAATFAAAGVRVALVEAASIGRGSTVASTALLLREPDLGLSELSQRYGARRARRIWQLSSDAARAFVRMIRRLDDDCGLTARDAIYYAARADAGEPLRAEYRRRRRAGFAGDWLTPGALRRLTAITGPGGIRTRNSAQFDPYRACRALVQAAVASGARVFERSPVTRIENLRGQVRIVTPGGTLRAQQVVIATGYATPSFQPPVGMFRLYHTYVLATQPLNGKQKRELGLGDVMLWDTERPYHYARWTDADRLLIGGADRPLVSGRRRAAAFTRATRELREYFERLLPALADVNIDYAWEGVFAVTPDGLPYIGPHQRYPRHLFALGYGGNGMTFGFLAARLLLERVQGIESSDHALFAFGRYRPAQSR